jgi:hypothetical protein
MQPSASTRFLARSTRARTSNHEIACGVKRLATVAGVLSFLTVTGGLTLFAVADTEYSTSSVALIAFGYIMTSIVALVGWLLVRAPWGRWSLLGAASYGMILASLSESPAVFGLYAIGAAAIVVLGGPWLTLWVRQHPPPGGPNHIALSLIVVAPISPLVVGLAAYDTAHWTHWLAALTAVVGSWAYGRGLPLSIWALRIAVPITWAMAMMTMSLPGGIAVAVSALVVGVLAWLPGATQTTLFPNPPLPTPRPQRRETSDAPD